MSLFEIAGCDTSTSIFREASLRSIKWPLVPSKGKYRHQIPNCVKVLRTSTPRVARDRRFPDTTMRCPSSLEAGS